MSIVIPLFFVELDSIHKAFAYDFILHTFIGEITTELFLGQVLQWMCGLLHYTIEFQNSMSHTVSDINIQACIQRDTGGIS
jgi:hypothetical protein